MKVKRLHQNLADAIDKGFGDLEVVHYHEDRHKALGQADVVCFEGREEKTGIPVLELSDGDADLTSRRRPGATIPFEADKGSYHWSKGPVTTRDEAIAALRALRTAGNPEKHIEADDILSELLTGLGYADVVAEYDKLHKWYE